ncbi:MAG: DUF6067 family protein [Verrucomicrobia bacterium]|nr:DUF6067 family protein [Verrucomicrobiota bacterium]
MKSTCPFITLVLALSAATAAPENPGPAEVPYSVADNMWNLELGAHRAKVRVDAPAPAIRAHLPWRLQLQGMEGHQILVMQAATGNAVKNVVRATADRMAGDIIFEAVTAGDYFIYYLPLRPYSNLNDISGYVGYACTADVAWRQIHRLADADLGHGGWRELPAAKVLEFQARTESDAFYPMEVIASADETKGLLKRYPQPLLLFPEDRLHTIRMQQDLPLRWIKSGPGDTFSGEALRHEYYAFQIGLFAPAQPANKISARFSDLKTDGGASIPASSLTCFNLGGIDGHGHAFTKVVNVPAGRVQALWFGVDVAKNQKPGTYAGAVEVQAEGIAPQAVHVRITVLPQEIAERGDNEPWRHSRLRWLNSTAGTGDVLPEPYTPLKVDGPSITCLGRRLTVGAGGLPSAIASAKSPVLQSPAKFIIEAQSGPLAFTPGKLQWLKQSAARVTWQSDSTSTSGSLSCTGEMEYDGQVRCRLAFTPSVDLDLKDIRLELPYQPESAPFILGAGHPGGLRPREFKWNWNGPFNSFWLGSADAGLHCKLLGGAYTGPMLNLYHPAPPASWGNGGKGGVTVTDQADAVIATAFSGPRKLKAGESVTFEFSLLITPVKPLDPPAHFKTRYYQGNNNLLKDGRGNDPEPPADAIALGVNVVNLHHASIYNPYINYPFIRNRELADFTARMHAKNIKVKVYNTIRELTSMVTELWALRSLGDEVIANGGGGGYAWCQEHMITGYRPAWFQRFGDSPPDAALVTSGDSRWQNYYIEGIGWLVRNVDIDGLYLDDVSYDRHILQRVRSVMAEAKPGCLIDLHSNTAFSVGSANHYAEFMPYIDRPWFGESYDYHAMTPDQWLVQVSGIPFGLMGEMLHEGGNPWRGALYGMTNRHGWLTNGILCDPRPVWKIWDRFGISDSRMIGYWETNIPVKTDHPQVLATTYVKQGHAMIALASWAAASAGVHLTIDWKALGLDPAKTVLHAPASPGFQNARQWKPGDSIPVEPGRGWLIIADESGPTAADTTTNEKLPRSMLLDETFTKPLARDWTIFASKQPGTAVMAGNGLSLTACANVSAGVERALPPGTTAAECVIDNQSDKGETWGPGMALFWPGGQALRINLRAPEHGFGLEVTGGVQKVKLGRLDAQGPVTLRIRLDDAQVIAEAQHEGDVWQPLGSYPRAEFPGFPNKLRLGKTRGVLDTTDHTTPGASGIATVRSLRVYGK